MTVAYFFAGGIALKAPGTELYDAFPVMHEWIDRVAAWTDLPVARLLVEDFSGALSIGHTGAPPDFRHVAEVRQVANALGICDVLAERGVRPAAIGGSSLGFMIGACLAGALGREELFDLLRFSSTLPRTVAGEPAQGFATVVATDDELVGYSAWPDVFLAAELGRFAGGSAGVYMLSGYLDALHDLARSQPEGKVTVVEVLGGAHNPRQQFMLELRKPYLDGMKFADPAVPLFSGLSPRVITTADQVYTDFLLNSTQFTSSSGVYAALAAQGTTLAVGPGVAGPLSKFGFPFTMVQVTGKAHFDLLAGTMADLGLQRGYLLEGTRK
ncbi:hypothetical protein [Amycolatopsis sp. CA-128772]|uniref:hypothetical protein n=1 Tax=Amycolatopsis sp. CA-128772 TaxID=2073159 RepID=UPI000CD1F836|nr:hypothetical protein [Amycolatopsis sp. CA-128772]